MCQAIAKDPVLSKCKIIAEPWDCGGLYLVGQFPNWDRYPYFCLSVVLFKVRICGDLFPSQPIK